MADFNPVIVFSLAQEGGFVNDPRDPGGATNFGIVLAGLSDWRGHPCTVADVKALTKTEALAIYRVRYWNTICGDLLPAGLDLMVFDFGINVGISRAAKQLQQICGVTQDGAIGPKSVAAAAGSPSVTRSRIANLYGLQEAYYHGLAQFPIYGKGWIARCVHRQAAAAALVTTTAPAPVLTPVS